MTWHILSSLSKLVCDPDEDLFSTWSTEFPLVSNRIFLFSWFCTSRARRWCHAWPTISAHVQLESAHDDEKITEGLIQMELDGGWLEPYQGTFTDLQQEYPDGISMGKLGVATSPSRPPDWWWIAKFAAWTKLLAPRERRTHFCQRWHALLSFKELFMYMVGAEHWHYINSQTGQATPFRKRTGIIFLERQTFCVSGSSVWSFI